MRLALEMFNEDSSESAFVNTAPARKAFIQAMKHVNAKAKKQLSI